MLTSSPPAPGAPLAGGSRALGFLDQARDLEASGQLEAAASAYAEAIAAAEQGHEPGILAEALRLTSILRHRLNEVTAARDLADRSRAVARAARLSLQEAKALNTLAAFDLTAGELDAARDRLRMALAAGADEPALAGRIHQNLGIIANIKGDQAEALGHYRQALQAFAAAQDERGTAMVHNSLGFLKAQRHEWDDAERHYAVSLEIATRLGDQQHRGQVLLNQADEQIARGRFVTAQRNAEEALRIFDTLGIMRLKSEAYRVLGAIYRGVGRKTLAEARLLAAVSAAQSAGAVLAEAEASRELALLFRELGRNQDALRLLNAAHRLFGRLDARTDLVDVRARVDALEGTFLSIVLEWGQSIESADSYTHGHCERVAAYGLAVARTLGLPDEELTTLRLGAYLHDVGKVRVPHEILNKPGRLTPEEYEVMKAHTLYGVELLEGIEFPWDIVPIVRSHHERYDGGGYPDGLRGDAIPLHAQIICIVDVFDALTTSRSYRVAMSRQEALAIIEHDAGWWRPEVFAAFMETMRDDWPEATSL